MIKIGVVQDESMGDDIKVTVIATGFDAPVIAVKSRGKDLLNIQKITFEAPVRETRHFQF